MLLVVVCYLLFFGLLFCLVMYDRGISWICIGFANGFAVSDRKF